ncbi:hypothetical protein [Streptomyces sp. NPDC018045]|uniref:hypothetical protein n=1 Tax=Streptomyces sp. NPDC018045 TaxID=3365037 RepID=UPI0037996406
MKTRETGSPGFHQALSAHQEAAPLHRRVGPAIAQAVQRQTAAMRTLSARAFPEPASDDVPAPLEAARAQRRHQAAATEAAAPRRARAERATRKEKERKRAAASVPRLGTHRMTRFRDLLRRWSADPAHWGSG